MAQSSVEPAILRIGSRGSPLALTQARAVRERLAAAHGLDPARISIEAIRTSGDMIQDRPLAEAGGKGLFTKEIEEALLAGRIDIAVHSAKDVPTFLPSGLVLAAYLPREDARDVLISSKAKTLQELAAGATVGTASPRRQAIVKRTRPDLQVISLRGNVETRLRKLGEGYADATILALAGLKRLDLTSAIATVMNADEFLPAVGQGAIVVETREDDSITREFLARIDHADTATALACERAFLAVLDGSCRAPIAGHATIAGDMLSFRGMILKPDGSQCFEASRRGNRGAATALGTDAGQELKKRGGPDFFLS
ncbi:MAG TPA: hydroxymethylbilane synthase [Xanthobacteraceae bacterium]|nr:hydroxymethylbilane synthase [Xanthobacteraceae bacterium]